MTAKSFRNVILKEAKRLKNLAVFSPRIAAVHKFSLSACSPFGKGGWRGILRGILRIYAYLLLIKSPQPLFSKEGDNGAGSKDNL
jgi:hypothetical protein